MKWLVCKAESEFSLEHDCDMYRAIECVQVFNTEEEADEACELFLSVDYNFDERWNFTYIVINSDEIGELVR